MFEARDHTFAICAYGESPYLQECIESLVAQSITSNIIMATSTPNTYLEELAQRYKIPLYVNQASAGIASDWNFAYDQAKSKLVTIAHQDDIYHCNYTSSVLTRINEAMNPLIFFTNYGELRNNERVEKNRLLTIKRALLKPLEVKSRQNSIFWRRRVLSLGAAICCPSVTMVKQALPNPLFREGFKTNLDWDAWERLSLLKGSFVYDSNILMYHRIHEESTTTKLIEDKTRNAEDESLFLRFWPRPIAKLINIVYAQSQNSNTL
ncbi:MAG: glycosyltransferase [Eggerthellaceae bacterium]|nr:glycosyltransferase [Eggerthellaceae bacterium]